MDNVLLYAYIRLRTSLYLSWYLMHAEQRQ